MLSTKNEKILQFYSSHPHIDFEKANLFLIDIFEYTLGQSNNEVITSNAMQQFQDKLSFLTENVSTMNDQLKQSSQHMLNLQTSVTEIPSHISLLREKYINELSSQKDDNAFLEKMRMVIGENMVNFDDLVSRSIKAFENGISSDQILHRFNESLQTNCNSLQKLILTSHDQIRENNVTNRESLQSIEQYFDRQKKSTFKGIDSEERVEILLNETFPDACIENTTGQAKSCDFKILRHEKPIIMIENKEYSNNVPLVEVEKFIRDIEHHKKSGILISQSSGIARKQNFQIDIHDGSVLIYIHHLNYDFDKLRLAVHTIDYIKTMLKDFNYEKEDFRVSLDVLKKLNKEYQQFLFQRNTMTETLKNFNKDMGKQIQSLELNTLSSIMSKHFSSTEAKVYICSYCKVKQFKNAKALAGHTRKCKKVYEERMAKEAEAAAATAAVTTATTAATTTAAEANVELSEEDDIETRFVEAVVRS